MGGADGGDCEGCVKVVKTMKQVRVPCHRNEYKQYTVKVPKCITETVPQTVKWTDMEKRSKQVAVKEFRKEKRVKYVNQKITVPDVKCVTKMVKVTKRVPKTIYVDMTTEEPRQNIVHGTKKRNKTITTTETRTKCVPKVTMVTKSIPVYSVVSKPAPAPAYGGAMGAAAGGMAVGGMAVGGAA